MEKTQISELAQTLHETRKKALEIEPLTKTRGDFSMEEAYQIQAQGIELRLADNEKILGYKMGLTSKAKMEQMGLHQPIYGVLTDTMAVAQGDTFSLSDKIHPKAEPELYFITSKELRGDLSREEALAACSSVGVAIEILDSRYKGFKYFTLPDVVADNSSSAFYILGDRVEAPYTTDFKDLKIAISDGGDNNFEASSKAILGDPLLSLCELVKLLGQSGKTLPQGSLVLAGAATQAIPLTQAGPIKATLEGVGSASFEVTL